jgi:hypothetical protein
VITPFEGAGISLHINEKFTNEKVEELEDTKKEICLSFLYLRLLIALWYLLAIVLSVLPLIYSF